MLKFGTPEDSVRNRMRMDAFELVLSHHTRMRDADDKKDETINSSPEPSKKKVELDPKLKKYAKMMKIGLSLDQIHGRMKMDGCGDQFDTFVAFVKGEKEKRLYSISFKHKFCVYCSRTSTTRCRKNSPTTRFTSHKFKKIWNDV